MNSFVTKRRALIGTILLCGAATAGNVSAEPIGGVNLQPLTINYSDLDMTRPESAAVLYQRIKAAARATCNRPSTGQLTHNSRYRQCYESTVAQAVQQVNDKTLTALHHAKTQHSAAS